jgi:hypothetical protein
MERTETLNLAPYTDRWILFFRAEERPDGLLEAVLGDRATGETREQLVRAEDVARVRPETVRRRFERSGFDWATPQKLVAR